MSDSPQTHNKGRRFVPALALVLPLQSLSRGFPPSEPYTMWITERLEPLPARRPAASPTRPLAATAILVSPSRTASVGPSKPSPLHPGLRLVNRQRPLSHLRPVQGSDGLLCLRAGRHLHKAKSLRPAGVPVPYERHLRHLPVRAERHLHLFLGSIKRHVTYVNSQLHILL